MQTESLLKEIGLTDKEIAIYLCLIELGAVPVRTLAQHSKINRGTTYDILKRLLELDLVNYLDKTTHQYFVASDPEKILMLVERKQKELEKVKKQVEETLPELKLIFEKRGGKPVVKLYEGPEGIRAILQDVLDSMEKASEKKYYVFSSASVRKNVYAAMPDFSSKRIKRGIAVQTISLGEGGQLVGLDERRWIASRKTGLDATYELIYDGKVAHISLDNTDNPVGVLIQNREIAETQKLIFEFNWSKL
ncbi:MAG: hypothetical protein A3H72_00170 [Candidatus Doudnabacteria bacterium RIFCSPLOWO2_02_FULL_48_8]|uniref:Transcription regulator TrmB N-terminal domain-containing protein n=1 Tax=Candidatus Doudnabacteria bacterium RIFCSPHIGHO2_01_FULL_46_24 TaxID=1817825 RepID=A0A1F5NU07_9BACT|nr:MAG: hypothetical protein A2720_01235 [Candidatus Doudnabacteria bacterium RIFCSPHIGHO2_01_FULL_46_24]OGE95159.1 MAG: hypothetical protein A3H72_00170 [Candidatus Doudnabacteria bacterium RIFCSPLOWO2_02_FULL_48_8]OGE96078.1 MAG: hypothetical protein A3E98_02425 [Candidatus Doudnabacteria bacterium RIFCSPHIGHO2_12_FULL_48_11]